MCVRLCERKRKRQRECVYVMCDYLQVLSFKDQLLLNQFGQGYFYFISVFSNQIIFIFFSLKEKYCKQHSVCNGLCFPYHIKLSSQLLSLIFCTSFSLLKLETQKCYFFNYGLHNFSVYVLLHLHSHSCILHINFLPFTNKGIKNIRKKYLAAYRVFLV